MIGGFFLASMFLDAANAGEVAVRDGAVRLGETQIVVLHESAGGFGDAATVRFDPVVSVSSVMLHDGDIHCLVTGTAIGSGAIEIEDGADLFRVDPGVVCFRDAGELGAILDSILAAKIAGLGPPAAGPLTGARELLGRLRRRAPDLNGTAAASLVGAIDRDLARASVLADLDFVFLRELMRTYLALLYRRESGGVCSFEDGSKVVAVPPELAFSHDVSQEDRKDIRDAAEELLKTLDPADLAEKASDVPSGEGNEERQPGGVIYHISTPGMAMGLAHGPAVYGLANASSNEVEIEVDLKVGTLTLKTPPWMLRTTRADKDSNRPIEVAFGAGDPKPGVEYQLTVSVDSPDQTVHVLWGAVVYVELISTVSTREPRQLLDSWGVAERFLEAAGAKISSNMRVRNFADIRTSLNGSVVQLSQTAQAHVDIRLGEVSADERVILAAPRVNEFLQVAGHEELRGKVSKDLVILDMDSALRASAFSRDWALGIVQTGTIVWVLPWAICYTSTETGPEAHALFPGSFWYLGLLGKSGAQFGKDSKLFQRQSYLALLRQAYFYSHDTEDLDLFIKSAEADEDLELSLGLKEIKRDLEKAVKDEGLEPGQREPTGLDNMEVKGKIETIHENAMDLFREEYRKVLHEERLSGEGP